MPERCRARHLRRRAACPGLAPRHVRRTRTRLGPAARTAYRVVHSAPASASPWHLRSAARAGAHRDAQPDAQAHAGTAARWSGGLARVRHGQAPPARAADVGSYVEKEAGRAGQLEHICLLAEAGRARGRPELHLALAGRIKAGGRIGRSLWGGCFPHRFWPAIPALFSTYIGSEGSISSHPCWAAATRTACTRRALSLVIGLGLG